MSGNERSTEPVDGRLALVSGGDRGVGPRIVRLLAGQGMRVVSASRSLQRARQGIDSLGQLADRVAVRELDNTDPASVARLMSWMTDRLGRCDVLVNTPTLRLTDDRGVASVAPDVVRRAAEDDLIGTWRLTRAVVPLMRAHGYGRIVNVLGGVENGSRQPRRLPAYEASASGISALTGQLASELVDDGILVNAYWPDGASHAGVPAEAVVWLATLPVDGPTGLVHR